MLKHILVPLDGSVLAETAVQYAKELVPFGGKITLLFVLHPTDVPIYDLYPMLMPSMVEHISSLRDVVPFAHDYLERVATPLRDSMGIEVITRVENGDPAATIIEVAKRIKPDAITMSTHGRTGLKGFILGSVTQKVLGVTSCPVLVVPNRHAIEEQQPEAANS